MGQFIGAKGLFTKNPNELDSIAKTYIDEGKKIIKDAPPHRNEYAKSLADRAFYHRVVRDKKKYNRKVHKDKNEEIEITEIDVAKVKALYDRPGTSGEKAAAAAALHRMGHGHYVKSDHPFNATQAKRTGPKKYKVTMKHEKEGKTHYHGPFHVHADDEMHAESKVRESLKKNWKGRKPEFHAHTTERV